MKKVVTLALTIALLVCSVTAIAESHAYPSINSFASMKVKRTDNDMLYTITLSKPVDRLLVNWSEIGAEPEELLVGDDLVATALAYGHKYRPGVEQKLGTTTMHDTYIYNKKGKVTKKILESRTGKGPVYFVERTDQYPSLVLKNGEYTDTTLWNYMQQYPGLEYEIVEPEQVFYDETITRTDEWGNKHTETVTLPMLDDDGNEVFTEGYIYAYSKTTTMNTNVHTVIAGKQQAAFMTVQGEWAVYYSISGAIVEIEYYEGQF